MYANLDGDRIADIKFEGSGCAISVSSASLLTEAVKGKTRGEVRSMFDAIHALLGKLAALSGVREFPARVKCASLCWHTLNAALDSQAEPVSTE
jgi:nitrogen fixation NifU-like protein